MSKTLIFDFDGTIADSFPAWIEIYNQLAPDFHLPPINPNEIDKFKDLNFKEFVANNHINPLNLSRIIVKVKQHLRPVIKDLPVFDGLIPVLEKLKKSAYPLGILTSNSSQNVRPFLNHHQIGHLFDFIYTGKDIFGKDKVIKRLLYQKQLGRDEVVYIGDEARDIDAAQKVGIPIISVTWGFNSSDVLSRHHPTALAAAPSDLPRLIKAI